MSLNRITKVCCMVYQWSFLLYLRIMVVVAIAVSAIHPAMRSVSHGGSQLFSGGFCDGII